MVVGVGLITFRLHDCHSLKEKRRIVKTVRPMLSKMTSLPIAGDQVFAAVERLHRNLDAVKQILTDEHTSSVRLVVKYGVLK